MAHHPWHDVELPTNLEDPLPAVIEIPQQSKVKYELDKTTGLLMVDRILFSAVHYPANYGFVPRTYCEDGDPLDILVYCQEPIASLSLMRAQVIGVMKMIDDKGEDDKLIAVHADDPEYAGYTDLWQLPPHRLRELKRFFEDYKALERKEVVVSDPMGRDEALKVLRAAIQLYNTNREALMAGSDPLPPVEPKTPVEIMPSVGEEPVTPAARKRRTATPTGKRPAAATKAAKATTTRKATRSTAKAAAKAPAKAAGTKATKTTTARKKA